MSINPILVVVALSLVIGAAARGQWRVWALMITSLLAIYWLQPSTPIRHLDFWLPTAALILTYFVWVLTAEKETASSATNLVTGLVIISVILLIALMRYLGTLCCLSPTVPPPVLQVITVVIAAAIISITALRLLTFRKAWIYALIVLILGLFVILKSEQLALWMSKVLRSVSGQSAQLATSMDIRWLGFSYVAFRMLHTLRDRLSGRLPDLSLQEYVIYIFFYPAYSAGPIDRVQRFVKNLQQPFIPSVESTLQGLKRILIGIFRKFVLADGLAIFALSILNASQVNSTFWLWIMVYAYAFRIYFDFSGYTDIALGLGNLVGIQLPENFERPYFKQNLTAFWNSWHITLANWFRGYFFNPLTRSLRSPNYRIPLPLIIFVGQLSTFILIGLWHGITWNFAIWGAWHGIGLFIHNRWSELIRSAGAKSNFKIIDSQMTAVLGTLVTFHYVSLGWIWFALSSPQQSMSVFKILFGLG